MKTENKRALLISGVALATPWRVDFPQEFRDRTQFFDLIDELAKLREVISIGKGFKFLAPPDLGKNNDVVLVGEGIRIHAIAAAVPVRITRSAKWSVTQWTGRVSSSDWLISFDKFPELKVKLYKKRGRPRKDFLRAEIRGQRAEIRDRKSPGANSWPKIAGRAGIKAEAARAYRERTAKSGK